MALTLISDTIFKPLLSPPAESIHTPLTVFDKAATNIHVIVLHAFKPPLPSNDVLKNALAKVLAYYPHLAGRFSKDEQGQECILLNNAGIRLIEANVSCTLADILPFDPSNEVSHLHPPFEGIDWLFQVQLNRYACGGLVLGYTTNHRVADGQSMSTFFVAWSRLVRGLDIKAIPIHDRVGTLVPRNHPRVEFDHRSIDMEHIIVPDSPGLPNPLEKLVTSFSKEFINRIKEKVAEENISPKQSYSTFECLMAHVWKKVTEARALDPEKSSELGIAVNCRQRTIPPVQEEYFGNLVLKVHPTLSVRQILLESYSYVAKAIHDALTKIDNEYIQSFTDFGELCKRNREELHPPLPLTGATLCPHLELHSWTRFNFHDLDFGSGPSVLCYPVLPFEGLAVLLPSVKYQGGIDVIIPLMSNHAHHFKIISHSLEKMVL